MQYTDRLLTFFSYLSPQNLLVIYTQQTVETHELDAPATVVNTFEIQGIKDFKVLDPHAQPKVHGKASTMTSNYSTTPPHPHAHTLTRPRARTHARTHTHTHTHTPYNHSEITTTSLFLRTKCLPTFI